MHDLSFDHEYDAVRHVLTAPAVRDRTAPFIDADDFDWEGLLAERESMSGGQALLVDIACELWHARKLVGLWEVSRRLDPRSFERVLTALALSRGLAELPRAA
jgi:hypothetical protein